VVVVGNSHDRGYYPENRENIPGVIRGYDAKTGRMLWRFNPVPQGRRAEQRDLGRRVVGIHGQRVAVGAALRPTRSSASSTCRPTRPTNDYYGGSRPGSNLYGTSLLALDVQTGKLRWFYQFVHHDVWNTTSRMRRT
jgi:quinoprotein glucose dehydrogenase